MAAGPTVTGVVGEVSWGLAGLMLPRCPAGTQGTVSGSCRYRCCCLIMTRTEERDQGGQRGQWDEKHTGRGEGRQGGKEDGSGGRGDGKEMGWGWER